MRDKRREYTNGEVTVYWEPELCIHIMNCIRNLPEVFNSAKRPWVDINAANTKEIISAVDTCPTGALTWKMNKDLVAGNESDKVVHSDSAKHKFAEIILSKDGPIMVSGDFVVLDDDGCVVKMPDKVSLCRCGASKNLPFCDDSHKEIGYKSEL